MFCSNCGNPLASTDKFCSNCGTPVPKVDLEDPLFKSEETEDLQKETEEIKIDPPTEKFDWNVHTFPGREPSPTEEIDFDWHMGEGEEIAFAPAPPQKAKEEPKQERRHFETPAFLKKDEPAIPVEPETTPATPEASSTVVEAPPVAEKKTEEKPAFAAPVFVGVGPKLASGDEKKSEKITETKKPFAWTFDAAVPQQDKVVGPKMWTPEASAEDIQGEALEKEIFENIATPENPTLARQTAKIDKFYTFNKKNEEFQKLLDREYEKFKGSRGEQTETFGSDVDVLRESARDKEEDIPESQVEEMAKARELFFSDDIDPADLSLADADAAQAGEAERGEEKPPVEPPATKTVEEKEVPEALEISQTSETTQAVDRTEDEKNAEAFWAEAGEEQPEKASKKEKSGKAGTVVIVILSIILVVLVVLLGIRFFAPESPAAKKMDQITNSIFSVFQGSDNAAVATDSNSSVPVEDKTGLIQLELDKNKDGAIKVIRYNGSLAWEEGKNYGEADINDSKKLTENKWYTDADKKDHFYDRSLVGTIIAYVSNNVENINTLDIGEIRQGEKGYYVWVAEYQADTVAQKIYLVSIDGQTMEVAESYTL